MEGAGGPQAEPAKRLGGSSLLLTALVASAYALTYAFYVVLSRNLPITEFGRAGGYLAVLGILTLVSASLIFGAARLVAQSPTPEGAARVRSGYIRPLRALVAALAVAAAAAAPFSIELSMLLGATAAAPLRDLHCGLLNGLKLNARFGTVVLVESVVRIAGAFATAWVPAAWFALACWMIAFVVGTALAFALLPGAARRRAGVVAVGKTTGEALLLRTPQVSFLNTDVVLVAALLGASEATGLYVAAALLSRVPFYLVTPHAMGELPAMVAEGPRGPAARSVLLLGALGSLAMAVPLALLPGFALTVGFGPAFEAGAPVLATLAATGFLLVQANTVAFILFAGGRGRNAAVVMGLGAGLEIALVFLLAPGGTPAIAAATALAAGATLAALAVVLLAELRHRRHRNDSS